jgi:uncharacterized protein
MTVDIDSRPFFEGLADNEICVQSCDCGHVQHPARAVCLACLVPNPQWRSIDASGSVYALTSRAGNDGADPTAIALVDLDVGVRMLGAVRPGADGALPGIGSRVRGVAHSGTAVVFVPGELT